MITTRAPLRIPLGGGGTDLASYYSNFGGFVLSAAIDKYVYIQLNTLKVEDFVPSSGKPCSSLASRGAISASYSMFT